MNTILLAESGYGTSALREQHPNIRYDFDEDTAYAQDFTIPVHEIAVTLREYNRIPV